MPNQQLSSWVHRRHWQSLWWQIQGACQGPLPIHLHTSSTGHPVSPDCFSIVHRETQGTIRHIKEAMYIRANTHLWTETLANTNCHIMGSNTTGQFRTQAQVITQVQTSYPPLPPAGTYTPLLTIVGGTTIFLVSIPCWGALKHSTLFLYTSYPFPLVLVGAIFGEYLTFIYLV